MGVVALRSNKEKMTNQEIAVLLTCKAKAIRDFTVGAFAASGLVWAATRKLSFGRRLSFSGVQKFAVSDVTEDPFDCIFGYNGVPEETSDTDNQSNLTKRQARSNRQAHGRRHRSQNQ